METICVIFIRAKIQVFTLFTLCNFILMDVWIDGKVANDKSNGFS